jgi:hypothetical protein
MGRYRLRIVLLSLGVVLGYGSAVAHFMHWHGYGYGYGHGHCRHDHWSDGHPDRPWQDDSHGSPPKSVQ